MRLELVTIGTELLLGFTIDTNGAFIGERLAEVGLRLVRRTSVGDEPDAIRSAIQDALDRTGFVITTGGLGPTRDDITKRIVAELFGAPLEFQPELWEALVARFAGFGRVPGASNRTQAEVPRGATVLPNRRGTAPGIWLEGAPGLVIMLPGVPGEMRGLLRDEVLPRLQARAGDAPIRSLVLRTTGIPESALGERLESIEGLLAPLTLAYLPGVSGVDLRFTAWSLPPDEAEERLVAAAAQIQAELGDLCYGSGDDDLARVLLDELARRGEKLVVAESCTGGMLGERITAVPGSSRVFQGGVIAYANEIKTDVLGVPAELVAEHGAVSEPVVRAMTEGVLRHFPGTAAIAVTGIAGPEGRTSDKPVVTVWLGFGVNGRVDARRLGLPGSRQEIRARATQAALHGLWRRVRGLPAD